MFVRKSDMKKCSCAGALTSTRFILYGQTFAQTHRVQLKGYRGAAEDVYLIVRGSAKLKPVGISTGKVRAFVMDCVLDLVHHK